VFYLLVFVAPLVWQSRLWDTYWDRYSGTHHGPKDPPWWLEHSEYLGLLGWLVAAATLCVVLLRAWARPGWRACCRWPAGCEGCGYDLQGVPAAGNCPECGKPIAESTVATRRDRGPARGGLVTLGDWFWCNGLALVRPKLLGGRLMTLSPSRGRAVLFAVTAAGVAGVATVGALTMTCVEMIRWEYAPDLEELVMTGTIAASASVLVTLLATLAGASVVGTSARLHTKRDLMPLAMDGALSLGGFWIIGHAVFWCVMVGVYLVTEVFEWIDTYSAMRVMLIGAVMLGTPLVLLVVYLMLLGRIVWAGRHANT